MRLAATFSLSTAAAAALVLGLNGIGRSLWLDEAWVANSILQPSLEEMFHYREWVQSSPPLFLLGSRAAVALLGVSNASLRAMPLLMAVLAAAGMFRLAARVLPLSYALLAVTLLVFFTAEVEYSHSAKQYSGEVAASVGLLLALVAYLERPGARRFAWLAAATAIAMPLSYPSVFLLPGAIAAVYFKDRSRAAALAAMAAAVLGALYVFFIRPNLSGELRPYWSWDPETAFSRGTLMALAALIVLAWASRLPLWAWLACVLPCILLAASAALQWYPLSYRTRLFLLPCYLLAATMSLEALSRRWRNAPLRTAIPLALAAAVAGLGIRAQLRADARVPKEDPDGAVQYLQQHVGPGDLLLIHPSVGESFRLYAAMHHWSDPPAVFGDTGWPCCPRGRTLRPHSYNEAALLADEDRMVPSGFSGRVWMLYTIRPTHWDWVGYDESKLWRSHLADRGCIVSAPFREFENLAISWADCVRAK